MVVNNYVMVTRPLLNMRRQRSKCTVNTTSPRRFGQGESGISGPFGTSSSALSPVVTFMGQPVSRFRTENELITIDSSSITPAKREGPILYSSSDSTFNKTEYFITYSSDSYGQRCILTTRCNGTWIETRSNSCRARAVSPFARILSVIINFAFFFHFSVGQMTRSSRSCSWQSSHNK